MSETGFPLVVLYVDTGDTFQGIADVGVGEFTYLIGGYYIGNSQIALLGVDGTALSLKCAAHNHFLKFDPFVQYHVFL